MNKIDIDIYREKTKFYKDYTFEMMMNIIMVEKMAFMIIFKYHGNQLLESDDTIKMRYLIAVKKFEPRTDIQNILFIKLKINPLELTSLIEDRELYVKEIDVYINSQHPI